MTNDDIADLFSGLGPITIRRMFGGKGIYHQGLIVALEVDGEVLLKADAESEGEFADAGSRQWAYEGKKRPIVMPYWSIPEGAYDDPDEMKIWTRKAYEATLRAKK